MGDAGTKVTGRARHFLRGDRAAEVQPYREGDDDAARQAGGPSLQGRHGGDALRGGAGRGLPPRRRSHPRAPPPRAELRAHDTRDATRGAARAAVGAVGGGYPSESLAPVVMRVLDSSNPKVKAAALELLSQVAPSAVGYLSTPAHVRSCVAKVLPGAADKNADVKRAAVAALTPSIPRVAPSSSSRWRCCRRSRRRRCDFRRAITGRPTSPTRSQRGRTPPRATPRKAAARRRRPRAHADDGGVTIPGPPAAAADDGRRPGAMADPFFGQGMNAGFEHGPTRRCRGGVACSASRAPPRRAGWAAAAAAVAAKTGWA